MASWLAAGRGVRGVPSTLKFLGMSALTVGIVAVTAIDVVTGPGFSPAMTVAGGLLALFATGTALLAAGVVDSRLRHGARAGILLYLVGCAWLIQEWDTPASPSAVAFTAGLLLYAACPAVAVHAALTYPTGRLGALAQRAVVFAGYLITIGILGLGSALFYVPAGQGCPACPANLLAIADAPRVSELSTRVGIWLGLAWLAIAGCLLIARLVSARGAGLRTIVPVVGCGLLYIVTVGVYFGRSVGRGLLGADTIDTRLWLAQGVSLTLVAAAAMVELIRIRLRHRALTRLVVDIGAAARPGHLRAAIAERLGDPGLDIAYPIGDGRHADADARPMDPLPAAGPGVTELHADGVHLATLVYRPGILWSTAEVDDLISAVHLALEHERLQAQGLAHLAELRDSGIRIVTAGDSERRRLERDLHDGAQQRLVGLALGVRMLRSRAPAHSSAIDAAAGELQQAIVELRDIARGLHPVVLRDAGLTAALRALAESRHLRITETSTDRYADVVESTAYMLVAQTTEAGPSTVAIRGDESTLTVEVDVDGEPESESLGVIIDRVTTLEGSFTSGSRNGRSRMTLTLPGRRAATFVPSQARGGDDSGGSMRAG